MNEPDFSDLATYALRLGDDALVLSHRLAQWSSCAPDLEEDIALTNIGLDLLGQARSLLTYAGQVEGLGRDEDDLAYLRGEREFANCQLVELPADDFAATIARQLYFSAYQLGLYSRLRSSREETLAAVAAKAVPEVAYHRDHAVQWTLRLGDGTAESHRRMQEALERLWPYTFELFATDDLLDRLAASGVAVNGRDLQKEWTRELTSVVSAATLAMPAASDWQPSGGRRGLHTEALGYLLAEMQSLHRAHPGVVW